MIFEITDIKIGEFLKKESREASEQLKGLRKQNAFLFASEEELPGVDIAARYFRSKYIARVSALAPFLPAKQMINFAKALRVVLLGPQAIDGSNKRKRSQSRAGKFGVKELSHSLLAFISTVVCILIRLSSCSY